MKWVEMKDETAKLWNLREMIGERGAEASAGPNVSACKCFSFIKSHLSVCQRLWRDGSSTLWLISELLGNWLLSLLCFYLWKPLIGQGFLMIFDFDENVNESWLKSSVLSGVFVTKLIKVIWKVCFGGWDADWSLYTLHRIHVFRPLCNTFISDIIIIKSHQWTLKIKVWVFFYSNKPFYNQSFQAYASFLSQSVI